MQREDFPLLCERFATSKLVTFDDLARVRTYGFRGEALASISHVARVTVVSMARGASLAYRASFADGRVVGDGVRPSAGVPGTSITVEDMFHNIPTRRAAVRGHAEEYARIVDVVQRYAVQHAVRGVAFTVRKVGGQSSGAGLSPDAHVRAGTAPIDVIGAVYGAAVKRELLPIAVSARWPPPAATDKAMSADESEQMTFNCTGYVSGANYSGKKGIAILFINDRLVECAPLQKALSAVYSDVLPKGGHAFTYLSIDLPPAHVDVNVHPTKRSVGFLHHDELIAAVSCAVSAALEGSNSSRTFTTAAVLPVADLVPAGPMDSQRHRGGSGAAASVVSDAIARLRSTPGGAAALATADERAAVFRSAYRYSSGADASPAADDNGRQPSIVEVDIVDPELAASAPRSSSEASVNFAAEETNPGVKVRGSRPGFAAASVARSAVLAAATRAAAGRGGAVKATAKGFALQSAASAPSKAVRVDGGLRSLEAYLVPTSSSSSASPQDAGGDALREDAAETSTAAPSRVAQRSGTTIVPVELTSVLELRSAVAADCHDMLRSMLPRAVFVGLIDERLSLIQVCSWGNGKGFLCRSS